MREFWELTLSVRFDLSIQESRAWAPKSQSVGSLSAERSMTKSLGAAYDFRNHMLGTLAVEHLDDGPHLQPSLPE